MEYFYESPEMNKLQDEVRIALDTNVMFKATLSPGDVSGVTIRPHILPESTIWADIQTGLNKSPILQKLLVENKSVPAYTFYPDDVLFSQNEDDGNTIVDIRSRNSTFSM